MIGVRIRHNQTNEILLDITDRITRIMGSFSTGTSDGAFAIPGVPANSTGFFVTDTQYTLSSTDKVPSFSFVNNVISWTFGTAQPGLTNRPATVTYGMY